MAKGAFGTSLPRVTLVIRNVTTNAGGEWSEKEALERLAAYSYLARLLDQCEVRRHSADLQHEGSGAQLAGD